MKRTAFYLAVALLATIIVGCKTKPAEKNEVEDVALLQPSDSSAVYSDTLLHHCVESLTALDAEAITDSTTLFAEVRKAIDIERGFLACFNALHPNSALSSAEKADSMANEAYTEIDSLGATGVTVNMIEYTDRHVYLERYRELLCYKDLVSPSSTMSPSLKKTLLGEAMAWHSFFDAVTEFAVQCVRIDFFTGGSMMAIAAPNCVWTAQECRATSLKALLYTGVPKQNNTPKDYEQQFIDKLTSRANSLYDTSMLQYIQDMDEQARYREECNLAKNEMFPKVISALKQWEQGRKTLVYSIHSSDNNLLYDNDVSSVLNKLSEIIEISY